MATYDAFISYSHTRDRRVATALQTVLQKFGQVGSKRTLRVFRDDTGLGAAPMLWPPIEQALGQSRFFILLASTDAAESEWVNREVAYWREHKGIEALLVGVTSGDLRWNSAAGDFIWDKYTPLPPALKSAFPAEPKWVDLRYFRWSDLRHYPLWRYDKFIDAAANFGATIWGVPKENLAWQELRQQRRQRWRKRLVVAALLVLGYFAWTQWREATTLRYQWPRPDLPAETAKATPQPPGKPIVLSLTADRALWLDDRKVEADELIPILRAMTDGNADHVIHLRADRKVSYDLVARLLGRLSAAGYRRVAFVVDQHEK